MQLPWVSYTETGHQPMSISRKAANKVDAIASVRLSNAYDLPNCWMLRPNIHAGVKYAINSKVAKIDIHDVNGGHLESGSSKSSRALFDIGVGAYIKDKMNPMTEYGLEYDLRLAEKYVGHQGSLTLRINF